MILRHIFLFAWVLFFSVSVSAANVANLYTASVQLPARLNESDLLNQAFNQAVDKVLFRVSGQKASIGSDVLASAHKSARGWVAQHRIQDLPDLVEFDGELQTARQVNVSFYSESINRFLYANGLAVWGSNRPSILLWLVQEKDGVRTVSGARQPSAELGQMFAYGKELGLPTYAPLQDRVDANALSAGALWGFFEDDILQASERYQTDVVFAVRMGQYGNAVNVDGVLFAPGAVPQRLSVNAPSEAVANEMIVEQLAEALSNRYASVRSAGSAQSLPVKVTGVNTYQALQNVKQYLDKVGVVRESRIQLIEGDSVELLLELDGSVDKFRNSVALNSMLLPKSLSALDPDANRVEMFEYKGSN